MKDEEPMLASNLSVLSTQSSALSPQHSALSTQHCLLSTQHSALSSLSSCPDHLYSAALVLCDADTLIPAGAVRTHHGMITAVGRRADFPRKPDYPETDLGDVVLAPGLVNAHAHLEYSCCRGMFAPGPFVPWLRGMIEAKRRLEHADINAGTAKGLRESARSGVTCIGDVSSFGLSLFWLEQSGLRYVFSHEVIGLAPPPYHKLLDDLERRIAAAPAGARGRIGLAPHAPYTVGRPLMTALRKRFHAGKGMPFTIHLAETSSERRCLRDQTGRLAALFRRIGFYDPAAGRDPAALAASPLEFLAAGDPHGESPPDLLIHGNDLTAAEMRILAGRSFPPTLVLCPGTRLFHAARGQVLGRALRCGLPVALGADSLASNDTLSIWVEMRRSIGLEKAWGPREAFAAATVGGARALGLEGQIGVLRPGYRADFIAVEAPRAFKSSALCLQSSVLSTQHSALSPAALLRSWLRPKTPPCVRGVWVNGEAVLLRPLFGVSGN